MGLLEPVFTEAGLVESWCCTDCAWCYKLNQPASLDGSAIDMLYQVARAKFNRHDCSDWPKQRAEGSTGE